MIWIWPGKGKTLIILKWLSLVRDPRCLIICPEKLFYNAWIDEAMKFKAFRRMSYGVLHGPTKYATIHAIGQQGVDVVLTTPDTLAALIKSHPQLFKYFRRLVVDESTKYKNAQGKRFKAIQKMLKNNPNIIQRVCMTGAPAPNGYIQLFSQFWIVGKTKVFNGDSFIQNYRNTYFRQRPGVKYPDFSLMPGSMGLIDKRLKKWIFQPNPKEYKEMPPILEYCYRIDLDKKFLEMDKLMKKKKVIKHKNHTITAANSGVALFKRMQLASGVVYKYEDPLDPASGRVPIFFHNYKTDVLEDIVDEHAGRNILVLYNYNHERDRICKRFKKARVLRSDRETRDWNKSKIPILVGHPASMGHGLNMQFGGNIIVWYSVPPDYEYWYQSIKRLHRGSIEEPVYVLYLVANNTVDDHLIEMVNRKQREDKGLQQRILMRQ